MRLSELQKIIKLLEESNIEEIEIKGIFRRVRVSKKKTLDITSSQSSPSSEVTSIQSTSGGQNGKSNLPSQEPKETSGNGIVAIKAPMVGTCYRAPAPDASPYVEIGDKINKGEVLCLIEAMKVMNEIESDVDGIIEKIFIKNEEPVEYGQELFLVKPFISGEPADVQKNLNS